MLRLSKILTILICVFFVQTINAQRTAIDEGDPTWLFVPDRLYTIADSLPNPVLYLPAHVDTASTYFSRDFFKWQWGKRIRLNSYGYMSTRGSQAYYDAQYGLNRWCNILSTIIKVSVMSGNTPKIISFIYQTGEGGSVKAVR